MTTGTDNLTIVGIDLACDPANTGIAVAQLHDGTVDLVHLGKGNEAPKRADTRVERTARSVAAVLKKAPQRHRGRVLYALDVPMGWPQPFVGRLAEKAGNAGVAWKVTVKEEQRLRARRTDMAIAGSGLGVQPYSVSMDKLGATAVFARQLLGYLCPSPSLLLPPRSKRPGNLEGDSAIEVYPSATYRAWYLGKDVPPRWAKQTVKQCWVTIHSDEVKNDVAADLVQQCLAEFKIRGSVDLCCRAMKKNSKGAWARRLSEHEWDALWCVVAALDYLEPDRMHVGEPPDRTFATDWVSEGFIWCRQPGLPGDEDARD